jgi:hypothetical protein
MAELDDAKIKEVQESLRKALDLYDAKDTSQVVKGSLIESDQKTNEALDGLISAKIKKFFNEKEFKNEISAAINKKTEDLGKKIESAKVSTIEALALFAAFFTFVSVNVQIFTKVSDLRSAMWFTILLLGSLGIFSLLTNFIIKNHDIGIKLVYRKFRLEISNKIILLAIAVIFIVTGLYFGKSEKLNGYEKSNNTDTYNINCDNNVSKP